MHLIIWNKLACNSHVAIQLYNYAYTDVNILQELQGFANLPPRPDWTKFTHYFVKWTDKSLVSPLAGIYTELLIILATVYACILNFVATSNS